MELFEEENVQKEKKTKNLIMIVMVLLVICILIAAALFLYISHLQSARLKVVIDGVSQSAGTDTYIFAEDGTLYVSIRDFAPIAGYSYYNGKYREYTEDTSSCNVTSSYEVASFEVNNSEYYKLQLDQTDNQYFTASKPITQINGKLYAPEDAIEKAFNVSISYNVNSNTISITTLNYWISTITAAYSNSAVAGTGSNIDFSIQKAVLYNYVITYNSTSRLYGVSTINSEGKLVELIGEKYTDIEFVETTQDFIVTTEANLKGLITNDGITRINPVYSELKLIDEEYDLYLIKEGNNYGVTNKSSKFIAYPEYEQIGVNKNLYTKDDIKNPYLLYDNCIPVCKDKKWGLIDRTGKIILPLEYDSIGCTTTTQRGQSINNILLVQEYEGIVVGKEKLYGLVNSLGNELLLCNLQEMYYKTEQGVDTAYMLYQSQEIDLVKYLEDNGITKVNSSTNKTTNTNTILTNTTTTNTTSTTNTSSENALQNETVTNNTQTNQPAEQATQEVTQ